MYLFLNLFPLFYLLPRMLKRTLFKEELEPNWPGPDKVGTVHREAVSTTVEVFQWLHMCSKLFSLLYILLSPWQLWDWDMWMRLDVIRKHRSAAPHVGHFLC